MAKRAILVLEDGSVYEGYTFGVETGAYGEVVFNTSMMGYQGMFEEAKLLQNSTPLSLLWTK